MDALAIRQVRSFNRTVTEGIGAFENEADRQAHLEGPIAQALMARAGDLFTQPPSIERIEVLGLKNQLA